MIKVLIVEDEPLYRDMLQIVLAQEPGIEVVGAYADSDSVLSDLDTLDSDVATLDIQIPGSINGFELGLRLRRERPDLGIVLLSNYRETAFLAAMRRRRMAGWSYLLKKSVNDLPTLLRAVKGAAVGHVVLDPDLITGLEASDTSPIADLTPRQRQILDLIAQGYSNSGIAEALHLSLKSVENQINRIFLRIGLDKDDRSIQPRVAAVLLYLRETQFIL